jgi:hypothetical protein
MIKSGYLWAFAGLIFHADLTNRQHDKSGALKEVKVHEQARYIKLCAELGLGE